LWGRALLVPYVLVFLVFVLYPVGYGLWLARHPDSYVRLLDDPIFYRTAVNTLIFVVVAVNVKMVVAMGAVDPDHPVGALHAQPGMGRDQQHHLPPDRAGRAELAERSDARVEFRDADAHLEIAAVLDADPGGGAAGDSG
jgi:hypothetical protein